MSNIFGNAMPAMNATSSAPNIMNMFKDPNVTGNLKNMAQQMQGLMSMGNGGIDNLLPMMAQKNPMLASFLPMLQGGMTPQQLVQNKLKELGVNEQDFMRNLQAML